MFEAQSAQQVFLYQYGNANKTGVYEADKQDYDTLESFKNDDEIEIIIEPDAFQDEAVPGPNGTVEMMRLITINGVQFRIKVGVPTKVPRKVYNHISQCRRDAQRQRVKPNQTVRIGEFLNRR